jgi:hypothetical protein
MQKIVFVFLLLSATLSAQTKPEKIDRRAGLVSYQYYIGAERVSPAKIELHLEKHDAKAYALYREGRRAGRNTWVWDIVGAAGILTGVFTDGTTAVAGYSVGVVGITGALITGGKAKRKSKQALKIYNTKYGY